MKQEVSKEEFERFINEYPRPLERHSVGFCDPPHLEFHDFTIGKPLGDPDSTVAHILMNHASYPNADGSFPPDRFFIDRPEAAGLHPVPTETKQ